MPVLLSRRGVFFLGLGLILPRIAMAAGDFAAWWPKFQAAVAKRDKEALAGMARFPMDWENGKLRKIESKEVFLAKFPAVITPELAKAVAQVQPQALPDGIYSITWRARGDEYSLYFEPGEGGEFFLHALSEGPG
jgi:hypothetical protein